MILFILLFLSGTINDTGKDKQPETEEALKISNLTPVSKDWDNYKIQEKFLVWAPTMQSDIYQLLAYETARYQVKPNFVFIDEGKKTEGLLNILVAHMSIIHVVFSNKGAILWEGSLYFQTEHGITVYSKENHELDLQVKDQNYRVTFSKDKLNFKLTLPTREDRVLVAENGSYRLFIYLFLLPTSIPPD
jgi:hypothetical protein